MLIVGPKPIVYRLYAIGKDDKRYYPITVKT